MPSADDAPASGVGDTAVAAGGVPDEEAAVAARRAGAVPPANWSVRFQVQIKKRWLKRPMVQEVPQ